MDQRRTRHGRDADEIRVDAEELGETLERGAELCEAGRHQWLEVIIVEVVVLRAEEPAEVEGAEIATVELCPHRDQRRETSSRMSRLRFSSAVSAAYSPWMLGVFSVDCLKPVSRTTSL